MKTVTVNSSTEYRIHIGTNLIACANQYIADIKAPCSIAIISNETIWPLYGDALSTCLSEAGYQVFCHLIPDGECYKTATTYLEILEFLSINQITRCDLVIALGGGVVGDLTGFVSATYLRGLDYIQIPTTLLAMVDSSVGGKTAIDLPQGKNLVGAFYQPKLVLCDLNALDTLPAPIFADGCAEIIKYGMLFDANLLAHLQQYGSNFDREYVVSRCVELKRDIVCLDEFDTGMRQLLNFGHTVGHAIEKSSNYTVSHGRAVGLGMATITKACSSNGTCPLDVFNTLVRVLEQFNLPTKVSDLPDSHNYSAQQLYSAALSDKKRNGSKINLVLPERIGHCAIQDIPIEQLYSIMESGL